MTVSGVQFDKMKVSPEQDALLYQHLSTNSDRVINDYKNSLKVSSSGLNIYIDTGAALIQGRLVTVDELEKLTVEANTSGYVCLTIDLTQTNTSTGTPGSADYLPVNNQVRAEILESLIQQDLKNDGKIFTYPLAEYTATGTSIQLVKLATTTKMTKVYEGATYLNASTAINFDASLFKKSMVIWFSRYDATNSAPLDRQFTPHHVNREMIDLKEGHSHVKILLDGAKKFFYVSKGGIVGNADNSVDINKNWCIRYVFVD